jgi:hypothetical protein
VRPDFGSWSAASKEGSGPSIIWRAVRRSAKRRACPATIEFVHDQANDLLIATPRWRISTQEDCEVWYRQWVDYLTPFARRMD